MQTNKVSQILLLFGGLILAKAIVQVIGLKVFMQIIQSFEDGISFKMLIGGFLITMFFQMLMQKSQKSHHQALPSGQELKVLTHPPWKSYQVHLHTSNFAT